MMNNRNLIKMVNELKMSPRIYTPSPYWKKLNLFHIQQLNDYGLQNFKRSVNRSYYNWGVIGFVYQQMPFVRSELMKGNFNPLIKSKYKKSNVQHANELEAGGKFFYGIFVSYLYDYISRIDHLDLLKRISEPSFGSPLLVSYHGKIISQDVCNSVHEFYSIMQVNNLNSKFEIAEMGAGYGRLAYVFLKALPRANYCIIDIPPALFVAQEYLKKVFPKEKIFSFRHFDNFNEIEKEFNSSRLRFLLPHQIENIPKDFFDITINIASFQEMATGQIKNYIKQIDRLTKGYFYSKQWKKAHAKENSFIKENEYPIPPKWRRIYHRKHPIQTMFFEALYKTRSD